MLHVKAIGWRAHSALVASGGVATVVAPISDSCYAKTSRELIWVGGGHALLHPRAVLVTTVPAHASGARIHLVLNGTTPWRPAVPRIRRDAAAAAAHVMDAALARLGPPRGFARLLLMDAPDDPLLRRAAPHARALAAACGRDETHAATEAARPLLGLGDGLTPAGDDYVGGVLFGRRLYGEIDDGWRSEMARIARDAAALTHPISARLLADLADGDGWAPLYDLSAALIAGDPASAYRAARALTTLGDTSGWSLLAGFRAALGPWPSCGDAWTPSSPMSAVRTGVPLERIVLEDGGGEQRTPPPS